MVLLRNGLPMVICLAGVACAGVTVVEGPDRLTVGNGRLTLGLNPVAKGTAVLLRDEGSGTDLAVGGATAPLFRLVLTPRGQSAAARQTVQATDAATVAWQCRPGPAAGSIELRYEGFTAAPGLRVRCTFSARDPDPLLRARLEADLPDTLLLEEVHFPCLLLRTPLAGDGAADAVALGLAKGGVLHNPAGLKAGQAIAGSQPGSLAAQFGCYYGPAVGLHTAAHDGTGFPKRLAMARTADGLLLSWTTSVYQPGAFRMPFDIVLTTFAGRDGAAADWRAAADLYREWALTQPWCARRYADREDIPAWMKAGPGMVRFTRDWLAEPARVRDWLRQYWAANCPDVPLVAALWGWEKVGSWVTPDYFPAFPNDDAFREVTAAIRAAGGHAFPWPSGYHWTQTFDKQADGTFRWDDRERFAKLAAAHAVHERDGRVYDQPRSWLRGGTTSCLCPGDPWTPDWWNREIAVPLAQRGCEMIQVDQVVGGAFPGCFSAEHGHSVGPGAWVADVFDRHLQSLFAACRAVEPQTVVGVEEPNERFIHRVGIQDYRDCETPYEPASVFNYLYHEFLPTFQSNPHPGDTMGMAYCLVTGQIPHLSPRRRHAPGPLLDNGSFEEWGDTTAAGWDQVKAYLGRDWNGRFRRETQNPHAGAAAICLENTQETDIVQVSQNVTVGGAFRIGGTYRLSAWLRTGRLARPNAVNCATLTADVKGTGASGRLPFPAAEAGWRRASCDFTVPDGTSFLRIMMHVDGPAQVWVDDMELEEVQPDGTVTPVRHDGTPPEHRLAKAWVELFHGEGRPYLLLGRMLHPPALDAEQIPWHGRNRPAVFVNAFEAPDGSRAVILANGSGLPRRVRFQWNGRPYDFTLEDQAVRLVR